MVVITYKFRLSPTKAQETALNKWLEECRMLYNNFIFQRKNSWEKEKKGLSLYDQLNLLPELKQTFPNLKMVYSQVLQNVGMRVDLAYQAYFRRVKRHEKPGYPRFKGFGRYDSFCYPCCVDIKFDEESVKLPKLGIIAGIFHRKITGKSKTVTIKRNHGKWYLYVVTDANNSKILSSNSKTVGIDVGIITFATFSDGNKIDNPRFFEIKQKQLAKAQRKLQLARDKSNKGQIKKLKKAVNHIHEKITNSRHNFAHQTANTIVRNYGTIIIEDINANSMIKKRWCNKQILDAAWGSFTNILTNKAECAGRQLVKINPAFTSKTCSSCGTRTLIELKDRIFKCDCGYSVDRDVNASKNILTLGLQSLA